MIHGQEKITLKILSGFKWTNSNFDDCTRYYQFRTDGYFEHWNCSMNELDTGVYQIINDTLKLYEYHLKSQVPIRFGGVEGTEIRYQSNYRLKFDTLWSVYYRDYKYNYETFERIPERSYIKIQKEKK
ncbi:MAG: hypothetical protein ACJAXX_002570 [Roseivirga sp.]